MMFRVNGNHTIQTSTIRPYITLSQNIKKKKYISADFDQYFKSIAENLGLAL